MGLLRRDVPFGESEKKSRRALYRIDDPFFRLWFRVVASHRGMLASAPRAARVSLLGRHWNVLLGTAWEELCRKRVAKLAASTPLGRLGPWLPASRWWHGAAPEWDVVSASLDGERLLLGEARWSGRRWRKADLEREANRLRSSPPPALGSAYQHCQPVRVLFVPELAATRMAAIGDVRIATCAQLLG